MSQKSCNQAQASSSHALIRCYYDSCHKSYQSLANLIRHINTYHIAHSVFCCPICMTYTSDLISYTHHLSSHSKKFNKKPTACDFLLSSHFRDQSIYLPPSNILKFPVLPAIEAARKVMNTFKLPLVPEVLDGFLQI